MHVRGGSPAPPAARNAAMLMLPDCSTSEAASYWWGMPATSLSVANQSAM